MVFLRGPLFRRVTFYIHFKIWSKTKQKRIEGWKESPLFTINKLIRTDLALFKKYVISSLRLSSQSRRMTYAVEYTEELRSMWVEGSWMWLQQGVGWFFSKALGLNDPDSRNLLAPHRQPVLSSRGTLLLFMWPRCCPNWLIWAVHDVRLNWVIGMQDSNQTTGWPASLGSA